MNYVAQNAPRIARALLEIAIKRGWPSLVDVLLAVCKSLEQQCWPTQHPLRQFPHALNPLLLHKLEDHGLTLERLWDMDATTIERIARHPRCGRPVRDVVDGFPDLSLDCDVQPITRSVLRVVLRITPEVREKDETRVSRHIQASCQSICIGAHTTASARCSVCALATWVVIWAVVGTAPPQTLAVQVA